MSDVNKKSDAEDILAEFQKAQEDKSVEDVEIVSKVKTSGNENIERILEDYLHKENLKK